MFKATGYRGMLWIPADREFTHLYTPLYSIVKMLEYILSPGSTVEFTAHIKKTLLPCGRESRVILVSISQ